MINSKQINKVAVLGPGTMGAGIGLTLALAGLKVTLYDINQNQLKSGLKRLSQVSELFSKENLITPKQRNEALTAIRPTDCLEEAIAGADLVIEAVPEIIAVKLDLFRHVEDLVSKEVILASNTSGLSINKIAGVLKEPSRFAGYHWFNPPEIIPLVEVIRGDKTSDEVVNELLDLAISLNKNPIVVKKDVPGFVGNRMQYALLREAIQLVADGVCSAKDVDTAIKKGVGFRWSWLGPLETAELGGLDVFYTVSEYLFSDLYNASEPQQMFAEKIDQGSLGIKTGDGFYHYTSGSAMDILNKRDIYFVRQLQLINDISKGSTV